MISVEARALLEKLQAEPRRISFPFTLPDRNTLDDAQKKRVWINDRPVSLYAILKRKANDDLRKFAAGFARRFVPAEGKILIACIWRESDKKRDPDNIISGGRKLLLDAIGPGRKGPRGWVGAGLIHCDGWHCTGTFFDVATLVPKSKEGVEIIVAPLQTELRFGVVPAAGAVVDLRS